MKPQRHSKAACHAITLIECVIYIAVFSVILGLSLTAYCRCLESSRHLQRTTGDIVRAINAGERWRDDVRLAKSVSCFGTILRVVQETNELEYTFDNAGTVWRRSGTNAPQRFLTGVASSTMDPTSRSRVIAWRWELELAPAHPSPRTKPLFTFEAVPATTLAP